MIQLKLHVAGLNFFHCDNCVKEFKFTPNELQQEFIACPNCKNMVPQENALSHRTLSANPKDTVATIKEKIHELYGVDTSSQNLLLLNTTFETFQEMDDSDDDSYSSSDDDDDLVIPKPIELEDDLLTLEQYGIKDGAQIVDVIERKI